MAGEPLCVQTQLHKTVRKGPWSPEALRACNNVVQRLPVALLCVTSDE